MTTYTYEQLEDMRDSGEYVEVRVKYTDLENEIQTTNVLVSNEVNYLIEDGDDTGLYYSCILLENIDDTYQEGTEVALAINEHELPELIFDEL